MAWMRSALLVAPTAFSATFWPLRNTVTTSDTRRMSSMKCEMKTMLRPSWRNRRRTPNSRSTSGGDSAEVGSSRMMMRAPENSTRAISTSCCTPIARSRMRRRGSISTPRRASCSTGLARSCDAIARNRTDPSAGCRERRSRPPKDRAPRSTPGEPWRCQPRAHRVPTGTGSRDRPARSDRRTRHASPAMIFISVLLPAPFSPTRPWISPARSAKSTPRSASTPPKDFVMPMQFEEPACLAASSGPRSGSAPPSTACRRRWPWSRRDHP